MQRQSSIGVNQWSSSIGFLSRTQSTADDVQEVPFEVPKTTVALAPRFLHLSKLLFAYTGEREHLRLNNKQLLNEMYEHSLSLYRHFESGLS